MMEMFYLVLAVLSWLLLIFAKAEWKFEMANRKRIERAYAINIELLEEDRDKWKAIAQGQREGDEWKDG